MSRTSSPDNGISSHLRRESNLMLWFAIGIPLGLTVLIFIFGPWLMNQLEIDRCLDAGGRYSHQTKTCEGMGKK